jgi:hypothetical protein
VCAVNCFVREAHLVKPYRAQEQGTLDQGGSRVQAYVVCEAGVLVSLSSEDVAVAAAEQASRPTPEAIVQRFAEECAR